jgi:RNA recognition motif. (a.k.a. RRM, RBD, or RNP domain)
LSDIEMVYKVFIKEMPKNTASYDFKNFLAKIVPIKSFKKSKNKGKHINNYVIVEVQSQRDADILIKNKYVYRGNRLDVSMYLSDNEKETRAAVAIKKKVYVNDLWLSVSQDDLVKIFSKIGAIESVFLKKKYTDETEKNGIVYSFISFVEEASVHKCLQATKSIFDLFKITLIRTVEESKKLNEAKYLDLLKSIESSCLSKTMNYYGAEQTSDLGRGYNDQKPPSNPNHFNKYKDISKNYKAVLEAK